MISITNSSHQTDSSIEAEMLGSFDTLLKREDLGFFKLVDREKNWQDVKVVADELRSKFSDFVFVGIGGSGLGGRAIHQAFIGKEESDRVHFLENLDSATVDSLFRQICIENTAWVFVSKSGSTLETLALANHVDQRLSMKGLKISDRTVVITESKQSPLHDWAQSIGARALEIPKDVGGRFSVLTPVGLLPAALLGLSVEQMREGAEWALAQSALVATLAAQMKQSFLREEWITQLWIYSDRFKVFGDWLQQLWAESLAKKLGRKGAVAQRVSTPQVCVGAIDQHSMLQQLMEGALDKWVVFFKLKAHAAEADRNLFDKLSHLEGKSLNEILETEQRATLKALVEEGRSVLEIELEEISDKSLGAAFMLFQLVIGTLGEAFDINAFDQPGVERGKALAKSMLQSDKS